MTIIIGKGLMIPESPSPFEGGFEPSPLLEFFGFNLKTLFTLDLRSFISSSKSGGPSLLELFITFEILLPIFPNNLSIISISFINIT